MTTPDERARILEWNTRIRSPQPRLAYRIPFPGGEPIMSSSPLRVPSPLSSHFQATFARQMEAQTVEIQSDPYDIAIPPRTLSNPPQYTSPTIEELEALTLDSGPRCDMGDCIVDDMLACTMWDLLQSNLHNARILEAVARGHRQRAAIEWERFRTRKFDRRMMGIIEREREAQKRFEEEGSAAPPIVVRNPTPPLAVILPGYKQTPSPIPIVARLPMHQPPPPPGHAQNPILIDVSDYKTSKASSSSSSSDYETAPESRRTTPEERKKFRRKRRIEQAYKRIDRRIAKEKR